MSVAVASPTSSFAPAASPSACVRAATPADEAARCALFARVAMETDLVLSVHRGPRFDALYAMQRAEWASVVVDMDGEVEGTATLLVRDGYLDGVRTPVGYLGDLRLSPRAEGRLLLDRVYGPLLEEARERTGCTLWLTTVIASNERALRALAATSARSVRAGRPRYTPLGDFDIRSLHLLMPRRRERSAFRVRRATAGDVPRIAALLDADARARPFGEPMPVGELSRRLRDWPGLTIESFYLAEDAREELVGCCALWDAAPVKRMVAMAYRGPMRRVRRLHDIGAALLGRPRLPRAGEAFRYQYITHQAVPSGDPAILRALLAAAYHDARARGDHFISACAPVGSALEPAYRGFQRTDLRARLFVVSLPGVEVPIDRLTRAWPGFEMALV